jgi:Beta protein
LVYRYVPLIRSKAGEATALTNLEPSTKARVFPVVHLTGTVSAQFTNRLIAAWTGRPIAIDGLFNFSENGSAVGMTGIIAALRAGGVPAQPSIEVSAPAAYVAASLPLAASHGTVVKARLGDLPHLINWCTANGLNPAQVDVILCVGHLPDFGPGVLDPIVAHSLQNFPGAGTWRSVTLAASAAPKDHTGLALGPNPVPRLDWQLWQAVHGVAPFQVDYGDHGIGHPDMTEPPGVAMARATVSARYTRDTDWLVVKGRPTSGATGIPMPAQYLAHANTFRGSPGFGGLPACWGDDRVVQIATTVTSSGSRGSWVALSANRHMELVVNRLP